MEKKKFYYDKITKTIEITPFYDEQIEKDLPYIELTFEEWEKQLSQCKYGYRKAFINNEIVEVEDEEVMNSDEYKESILPAGYKRFVIEAGCSSDWYKYVYAERYLININEFGKSGTKEELEFYFKLDSESIKKHIKEVLK